MLYTLPDNTAKDFELLTEVSNMLTSFDETRVLKNVIDLVMGSFEVEQSSLLLTENGFSSATGDWRFFTLAPRFKTSKLRIPPNPEAYAQAQKIVNEGLARWVIENKRGTLVTDAATDARWLELDGARSLAGSALAVPFIHENRVVGVFTLMHPSPEHFNEHDLQIMTIIANQVAVALRNAQLFTRMQAQQTQLEAVLHALPDVLFVLNAQGQLLLMNEAGAALFGSPSEADVRGKSLSDMRHADSTLMRVLDILSSPEAGRKNWSFEARSEQQHRDYHIDISVWENAATNHKTGYVIVMRDVTQMRDLNRFKDEMLQMASHDLRSPLALIVGYCSLMQLDIDPNTKIAEYLGIVQQQTERMTGLLDDLLRVEKIRTSPSELNERVDFRAIVQTALNNMRPAVENKQQTLKTNITLDSPTQITINPSLIREAMENLLSNAVKYTPAKGTLTVYAYQEGRRVHYVVEDTGIGIPAEHLSRLFNTFFRARQAGTEDIEGRGLGLSLVKSIIERHNGEVWVESTVGVGSRFGFWLPMD
ncbi:MAG: ATP-binding protein [Chloroflexota bacterium]|nr:ATP-binding protein [Chloroflexota bacterium]